MKPSQSDEQKILAYRVPASTSNLCSPNPDFLPYTMQFFVDIFTSLLHLQQQQLLLTFSTNKCFQYAGYCLEVLCMYHFISASDRLREVDLLKADTAEV